MISITRNSRINNSIIVYVGKYSARVVGHMRTIVIIQGYLVIICAATTRARRMQVALSISPLEIRSQQIKHKTQRKSAIVRFKDYQFIQLIDSCVKKHYSNQQSYVIFSNRYYFLRNFLYL